MKREGGPRMESLRKIVPVFCIALFTLLTSTRTFGQCGTCFTYDDPDESCCDSGCTVHTCEPDYSEVTGEGMEVPQEVFFNCGKATRMKPSSNLSCSTPREHVGLIVSQETGVIPLICQFGADGRQPGK